MDFKEFVGLSTGLKKIEYNWRDVALYALAVGANENDLVYIYEKKMKAIPSFGATPYWSAVNVEPKCPIPRPASALMAEAIERATGTMPVRLHMEHEIVLHRPIDPIKGTFVFEGTITGIYDRGPGKGIVVQERLPVYDEAGNLIVENIANSAFLVGGGFGGERPPKNNVVFPDREPDYLIADHMSQTQNALYRLTGDTNYAHIDPDVAKESGFPQPFMQGLCTYGFACRMAIQAVIPGEPERMQRMAAQMRSICYPGCDIELRAWNDGEGRVVFQLIDKETRKAVLDKGIFEFR